MRLFSKPGSEDYLAVSEIVLLWLAVSIAVAIAYWPRLDDSFASTDNLMRLVQVRALLDGAPWFDPHESRLAPPLGYDTHWSRLIDGGIAGLILLARQIVSPDLAERLARCVWPLLLSGPAVLSVIAIAARLGGGGAGRAVLIPALLMPALLPTFRPGEIDHHNAQVMLSLTVLACALWSDRRPTAMYAGIAAGALLSIGLEAAYVVVLTAAGLGLLLVADPIWRRPARDFAAALGGSTVVGYLLVTPAASRLAPQCDALAINSMLAVAIGAAGLWAAACFTGEWSRIGRFCALLAGGGLALTVYAASEPRCLSGPFGLVDRSIFPLWLNHVQEMQPLSSLFQSQGFGAAVYMGFPLVAAFAAIIMIRAGLRTPLAWILLASFAIAVLLMLGQIRIIVYVFWFGLPFIGVAAQLLAEKTSRLAVVRLSLAVLASPIVVSVMLTALPAQNAQARDREQADGELAACFQPEPYRRLAALPNGVVLGPLDLGPSILAHTGHAVVAAPYHRADRAIRFNQEVMDGPNAMARQRVLAAGIDYVISCEAYRRRTESGSFHEALFADAAGSWLLAVPAQPGDIIRIWRVLR